MQKRPFRFLLARLLVKSGLCRLLIIQQRGYRLRFYPSNLTEQLWIEPQLREADLNLFRLYLKPGDKVIDVGANIGDISLTASVCVGVDGRVWAIEPHPRIFHFLKANLALNYASNVEALNFAAGETSGDVTFTNDRRDDMNRIGDGTLKVSLRRLDELVDCRDSIALLKVDVEGYEKQVFLGAKLILQHTNCVYFEIGPRPLEFGYSNSDLLQLLESEGFQLFRISSIGQLSKIQASYDNDVMENLVALKRPTEFSDRTGWTVKQ
jgi:FkbM family methyltransferase